MVSVVMVTYNHENYIKEAIESVLAQKTQYSYELLIGEDESQDGTRTICQEYAEKHPDKIKLFLRSRKDVIINFGKPNGAYNWMETIKAAKGKYIAILDGDDYWISTDKLEKQILFLEGNKTYAGSYHNSRIEFLNYSKKSELYRSSLRPEMDAKDMIAIDSPFHTSSFVFKTSTFFPIPSWLINMYSGDMALFFIAACNGKLKGFENILSAYRKHAGGVTKTGDPNKQKYIMLNRIMMLTFFDEHSKGKYSDKITKVMDHHFLTLYREFPNQGFFGVLRLANSYLKHKLSRLIKSK
jgi:glycosyltransferase involved in cell wall biosynthesis